MMQIKAVGWFDIDGWRGLKVGRQECSSKWGRRGGPTAPRLGAAGFGAYKLAEERRQ